MSAEHLTIGSEEPPRVEGLIRLYSMQYCPFAQRTRLVLIAKDIPHDVVNVNLFKKPEWYLKIHPEGKVPALLDGSKIIVESLDISDYLDDKFPDKNPLYPSDSTAKQKDKELITKWGSVLKVFVECIYTDKNQTPEQWLKDFIDALQVYEDELASRNTTFFGGEKPAMVDYMIWPWAERAPFVAIKLGQKLPMQHNQLPLLRKWRKAMKEDGAVKKTTSSIEKMWQITNAKLKGVEPNYDD